MVVVNGALAAAVSVTPLVSTSAEKFFCNTVHSVGLLFLDFLLPFITPVMYGVTRTETVISDKVDQILVWGQTCCVFRPVAGFNPVT